MIKYNGIKTIDKSVFLCFSNESSGSQVEVPVDAITADRVKKYLSRISPPAAEKDPDNDEGTD